MLYKRIIYKVIIGIICFISSFNIVSGQDNNSHCNVFLYSKYLSKGKFAVISLFFEEGKYVEFMYGTGNCDYVSAGSFLYKSDTVIMEEPVKYLFRGRNIYLIGNTNEIIRSERLKLVSNKKLLRLYNNYKEGFEQAGIHLIDGCLVKQ